MPVANTFWENFFLLLIFVPLAMIWGFALVDIFRRDDMGGVSKALWVAVVILVPFFGTLIYLVARPAGGTAEERAMIEAVNREYAAPSSSPPDATARLEVLAALHDRGKLTDSEFAAEKSKVLDARRPMPV